MTGAPKPSARPWTSRVMVLVLVLGALYRLVPFVRNPSLIVDDAMLALNVATRSFGGLLHPLDLGQTAPPAFLWAVKALTLLAGVNEFALRSLPLAAGIVLPFACWKLAKQMGVSLPAPLVAALAAVSPIVLQYSVTAKPYVVDALATVWVLHSALVVLDHPERAEAWWKLLAAGLGALVLSTPAVLVLAGVVGTLGASRIKPGRLALITAVWSGVFAVIYFGILRPESANPYIRTFWAARFLPPSVLTHPATVWNVIKRLPAGTMLMARGTSEPTLVFWALAGLGVWRLGRKAADRAALLLAPVAAMLGAAVLRLYPVSPRLDLFLAPIYFILLGAAWEWGEDFGPGMAFASRGLGCILVAGLVLVGLKTDPWAPGIRSTTRIPLGHTPVYVYSAAIPDWAFYTTDWKNPDTARVRAIIATQGFTGESFHNAAGRGRAVTDSEGAGLVVMSGKRAELLGLAPGMQYREGAMFSQKSPDRGWASREAHRIRGAGDTVWVVAAPTNSGSVRELLDSLAGRGAHEDNIRTDHLATIFQLVFHP